MDSIVHLRVETEPASGAWNMAVDEAVLEDAIASGIGRVRLYRWSEATLSLGHFQTSEDRLSDPLLAELPWVKRLSGGGAIVHHHELTYSCVVPPGNQFARNPLGLYDVVHEAIATLLGRRGAHVRLRGEANPEAEDRFLCFGRGDPRDLVFRGHKVLGSAQRRRRGAVLQHGSLLLHRSPYAAAHPGLIDLAPTLETTDLADDLAASIASKLASQTVFEPAEHIDESAARTLETVAKRDV